jgi:formylglycine-generating enzyme required for sulfatase activity
VQGCAPAIRGEGVPDTANATGFEIVVGQMPGQRMGLIFYGMSAIPQPQPWALGSSSYLCIYYPVARTGARSSGGSAGTCNGELRVDFNTFLAVNPSALGAPFSAGQQLFAQGWYRDPGAAKGTNLSDTLRFSLCTNATDTTQPVITTCASNQTVSAVANCQGVVPDFTSGIAAIDNCTTVTITQSPAQGTTVPLGAHQVTISAADGSGNIAQCVAVLTVADTTGPNITVCASNQTIAAGSNCQGLVPDFTLGVVAADSCGGSVTVSQSPVAGVLTDIGQTTRIVSITARDQWGNATACTATLTVTQSSQCQATTGFVAIQPGTFQMGDTIISEIVHSVTISYPFWISASEVSQSKYAAVMGLNPSRYIGSSLPVERVSWNDARAYCAALTAQQSALGNLPAGYEYRLPTEAEWEYSCRAGTTTAYNVPSPLDCSKANVYVYGFYCVGQTGGFGYAPNAWGLHRMHGNVSEWCLDSYAPYSASSITDPFVSGGSCRIFRGGGWNDEPYYCRSAIRDCDSPNSTSDNRGFRVVLGPIRVP